MQINQNASHRMQNETIKTKKTKKIEEVNKKSKKKTIHCMSQTELQTHLLHS